MNLSRDGERLQYHGSPEEGGHRWQQEAGEEIPRRHAELVWLLAEERGRHEQAARRLAEVQLIRESQGREIAEKGEQISRADQRLVDLQHALDEERDRVHCLRGDLGAANRQLAEHKGIWREAVRALLKETRAAASLSPLLTRDLANALLCAKSGEQRIVLVRDDLRPIAKVAERFGWQVEEPLAEWLEAALTWHEPGEEIKRAAQAHGYDPAGPQRLPDFIGDKLHALERFKEAHATEEQRVRQLQADLAEMRESWTSANRREEQTSRGLSMLKLRVQELLELAQTALKEE